MPDRTIEPTPIPVSAAPQGSVFLTGEQDNRKRTLSPSGGMARRHETIVPPRPAGPGPEVSAGAARTTPFPTRG